MKQALFVIGIVIVAAVYAAGYWPEHGRRTRAEAVTRELQARLDRASAQVRLGEVLGQVLRVCDAVAAGNFGEAAVLSSAYFDRVRQETASQPDAKQTLERILQDRDQVTAALARTDAAVSAQLRRQVLELRKALGYAVEREGADQSAAD